MYIHTLQVFRKYTMKDREYAYSYNNNYVTLKIVCLKYLSITTKSRQLMV